MDWRPFVLSLEVTAVATLLVVAIGLLLGLLLARVRFPGARLLEAVVMLPLVLPPSVVGYYLLRFLGREGPITSWLGLDLLFTLGAATLASTVVALPLMVQAARAAFLGVDPILENAARTLGHSEPALLLRVTLPLAKRGLLAGAVLGAARALGEFGATLMVAGSIPGRTQTLPVYVYDLVQNRDYGLANTVVLLMTLFSFVSLWGVRRLTESG